MANETISRWISQLIKRGYLISQIIYEDGTKEIKERRLYIKSIPIDEKINTPIDENVKDNNTSINNNNIYIASKEKELFDYWNSLEIIKHKQLTEPIRKAIKKAIDTYKDIEVIKEAINNYNTVLKDENYYYSYKFTLEKFLKQNNGIGDFISEEGMKWINYTSSKLKPVTEASTSSEDNIINFNGLSVEDTFKLLKEIKK